MSSKVKTEAQQRKLDLRSVKKKNLFKKKKDPTSNYAPVVSPGESLTDRATKQEVKKKLVLTEKHLELLKLFDHNRDYGPCIDLTRLERWNRAKENGLKPPKGIEPDELEAILSQHVENPAVQECVWSKHKL